MDFLHNISPARLEELYLLWRQAPQRLGADWQAFFAGFELAGAEPAPMAPEVALRQSAVQSLIYRYRDIGHLLACTDPLSPCKVDHPLLSLSAFGLGAADLDQVFHTRRFMKKSATLREILAVLRETYCRSIGVEFMHIQEPAERQWLIDRMEPVRNRSSFTPGERIAILAKLKEATMFEGFLHRKFPGQTRFSLEGGEVLIPLLDEAVSHAAHLGVTDLVLGMPHRGRLTVLAAVFRRPLENLLAEFGDNAEHGVVGEGDVKYHRGFSTNFTVADGSTIHLTMATNPSHLEAIDPVLEGKCRARQDRRGGGAGVLPVLIHGDAAFSGQGVVAETFNLSQLEGYRTGGTLHVVVNNQIGFTTLAAAARSSCYATDVAKMVMAPIFHVHGEDPEAAVHVLRLALDYRQAFARDVVIEVICYRRYGHNEGDEPYFTQPLMYEKIKDRPPVAELYARTVAEQGVDEERIAGLEGEITARLEGALGRKAAPVDEGFAGEWSGVQRDYAHLAVETGVKKERLQVLAGLLSQVPAGFTPHPKIMALLEKRREAVTQGEGIDWGNGESLAFASLLAEGISVRLSGQDVRRGTFSQRHAALFDMKTEKPCAPLAATAREGAAFYVYDSMLSENAVLGFDYGYSLESPAALVIWEAQFGDFANGGQVVIDQFVASGEAKWERVSGLVMLLPHGYEGHGPEHSSARIERYLQLCADNNLQVATPSTPAQYFHLLRRQVKQPFRKPLIVFTPKSLLRHPRCVSPLADLETGPFREVLGDGANPAKVRAVLLCSGKIFFELLERKEREGRDDVAIIRIEQLYPLRTDLLGEALAQYRSAGHFVWVQEEPANMGGWNFLRPQLAEILGEEPGYVGRPAAASPATGSHRLHKEEQGRVIEEAFSAA
ncbi:MAG: 2-oxoglutarate dehydrogenase E1 component [Geobacteraceae bacterium]|nr:2-oxoglutarate dehydrogenase E1 component [Geobacteraceae bacterium]